VACITIPLAMTLGEAISPHTFDTPFLMLSGAALILGVTFIPLPESESMRLIVGLTVGIGGGAMLIAILAGIVVYVVRHPIQPAKSMLINDDED
jgi:hypothetical protein